MKFIDKIQLRYSNLAALFVLFLLPFGALGRSSSTLKADDIKVSAKAYDLYGCNQTDLDVPVMITNLSGTKITSLPMMKIYLNDTVRQRFSLSLNPGDSTVIVFDDPFKESNIGTYVVRVRLDSTDGNQSNNQVALIYHLTNAPDAKFSFSNVCAGDTSNFANLTNLTQNDTVEFKWLFGDGDTSTGYNVKHFYEPQNTGEDRIYNASLIAIVGGCKDTVTHGVNVYGIPDAGYTYRVEKLTLSILTIAHDDTTSNFYWDFGDKSNSNKMKPEHTYEKDQEVDLCLTVTTSNGCVGQHCETFLLGDVGIGSIGIDPVSINPNPADHQFSLTGLPNDIQRKDLTVSVLSVEGKVLLQFNGTAESYDVSSLASGMYYISVASENFYSVKKLQVR